jgi:hypothetical protein
MSAPGTISITGQPSRSTRGPTVRACSAKAGFERMNRTLKEVTVKRFYYETHGQLRKRLANFVTAYNFAKRLKTLKRLTPYEFICKCWTKEPQRFTSNPHYQTPRLNI